MRIWHESLIPKLCRPHLLAMWREGLGAYTIITENKKGYRNHPAVKEFENNINQLMVRLSKTREEMLNRKYQPKKLPFLIERDLPIGSSISLIPSTSVDLLETIPWQTLEQQIEILKSKNCECKLESIGGE